jgi:hypothetical protein
MAKKIIDVKVLKNFRFSSPPVKNKFAGGMSVCRHMCVSFVGVSGEYEHATFKIMAPSNDSKKQNYDFAQNGCIRFITF